MTEMASAINLPRVVLFSAFTTPPSENLTAQKNATVIQILTGNAGQAGGSGGNGTNGGADGTPGATAIAAHRDNPEAATMGSN
jgi:hypothetical protein